MDVNNTMEAITLKQKLLLLGAFLIMLPIALFFISLGVKKSSQTPISTPKVSEIPTNTINPYTGGTAAVTKQPIPSPTPLPPLVLLSSDPANGSNNVTAYKTFTFTFNRFIYPKELSVTSFPTTPFTMRLDNAIMYLDVPSMKDSTQYTFTIIFKDGRSTSITITTIAANSSVYQDTSGQEANTWTINNRPDVTVYNALPYSTSSFSVQPASNPGHYSFIVTLTSDSGKQDFMTWLKTSVGLNDTQIGKLDIQYQ